VTVIPNPEAAGEEAAFTVLGAAPFAFKGARLLITVATTRWQKPDGELLEEN
jgi:hypothetical protein